jgi:hypothetical protein
MKAETDSNKSIEEFDMHSKEATAYKYRDLNWKIRKINIISVFS